jgi:hypothetical protein
MQHRAYGSPRFARDDGARDARPGENRKAAMLWPLRVLRNAPVALGLCLFACTYVAHAETVASCGGFAMLGGAQINCSHIQPTAPAQFCTFSWALMTTANTLSTIQGSFLLPPGANNVTVYQGAGFNAALSNPIVLCQGKKSR